MVETLAISTAQALEEAEARYNEVHAKALDANRKKAAEREAAITKMHEKLKVTTGATDTSKQDTKLMRQTGTDFGDDIDLDGHLDNFTFMRVGGRNDDEIKAAKEKIGKFPGNTKDMLLRCLHRGIGSSQGFRFQVPPSLREVVPNGLPQSGFLNRHTRLRNQHAVQDRYLRRRQCFPQFSPVPANGRSCRPSWS
jgi:hypothetical protein